MENEQIHRCMQIDSDEVQRLDVLAEVFVGDRHCILLWAFGPLTDQIRKSVRVLDRGRDLDRPTDVVVGEAQLVGEHLDQVGILADRVVHDHVVGRRDHALPRGLTDQEEIVRVGRHDVRVHHRARLGVAESRLVRPGEEALVHPLVHQDDHNFDSVF